MVCSATTYTGVRHDGFAWSNWSGRVRRTLGAYFVPAPLPVDLPAIPLLPPLGLPQLVRLVADASATGKSLHAVGSGWAFDDLAVGDDWTVSLGRLASRLFTTVGATPGAGLPAGAAGSGPGLTDEWFARQADPAATTRLVHVEAGVTLARLVDVLAADGLALPTLGGANGQALAGVVNTSVHGGDWDCGPFPDLVRAIHLVTHGGQEVWVEPASRPVTVDERLRATLACPDVRIVRSDEVFDAARVGLGRFGVVYSYVLEVRPAFRVAELTTQVSPQAALDALLAGRSDARPFDRLFALLDTGVAPATLPEARGGRAPSFFQLVWSSRDGARTWAQRRWETTDPTDLNLPGVTDFPGDVVAWGLQALFDLGARHGVDAAARAVFEDQMRASSDQGRRGPHALVTAGPTSAGPSSYRGISAEVIFDASRPEYVDFLRSVLASAPGFEQVGWISLRPSRSSNATLSMHNVAGEHAVSIEFALLGGLRDNERFLEHVQREAIARGGRPHWGQVNTLLDARTVSALYGAQVEAWRRALGAVSGSSTVFSNAFTRARGLEPLPSLPQVGVCVPATDQLLVAASGPLRTRTWGPLGGGGWGWDAWQPGELAVAHGPGQVTALTEGPRSHLLRVGVDGWVYLRTRRADGSWSWWWPAGRSNERPLQGVPGGAVHAVSTGEGSLHVTYADRQGWVVASRADTGAGTTWPETVRVRGGRTAPGGHVTGVSRRAGQLDVFTVGTDRHVYTAAWNAGSGWQGWWQVPGVTAPPGAPVSAVVRSLDLLDVFVADDSGQVMTAAWAPGAGWAGWWSVQGGSTAPGGHVAAVSRSVDLLDVFVAAGDARLATAAWSPTTGWRGWWDLNGATASAPGAPVAPVSRSKDLLDVFLVDAAGSVQTLAWAPGRPWGGPWQVS